MSDGVKKNVPVMDDIELKEWLASLDYVLNNGSPERVQYLLQQLQIRAQESGVTLPFTLNTPYINTITKEKQPPFPGNRELERRIKSIIRWNAMAMVVRANKVADGIGGHISTYASSATLYEIGFNHFFRAKPPRVFMPALLWKAVSPNKIWSISVVNCSPAAAFRRILTRG